MAALPGWPGRVPGAYQPVFQGFCGVAIEPSSARPTCSTTASIPTLGITMRTGMPTEAGGGPLATGCGGGTGVGVGGGGGGGSGIGVGVGGAGGGGGAGVGAGTSGAAATTVGASAVAVGGVARPGAGVAVAVIIGVAGALVAVGGAVASMVGVGAAIVVLAGVGVSVGRPVGDGVATAATTDGCAVAVGGAAGTAPERRAKTTAPAKITRLIANAVAGSRRLLSIAILRFAVTTLAE